MCWFRTGALLCCALLVGACGFRPLYGGYRDGTAPAELATVKIDTIHDRIGQQVHNHLLDLINPRGRPVEPRYRLRVTLSEGIERLAVQKSELATRANFRLIASFVLHPVDSDQVLISGDSVVVSSYNILTADFATLISEKDARARAAREVAADVRSRLAVYFVQRQGNEVPATQ